MRPSVRADRVTRGRDPFQDFRMPDSVFSDDEKGCFGAMACQSVKNSGCGIRPRPIIESQHDLAWFKKVVDLVLGETKSRASLGIDFDRP